MKFPQGVAVLWFLFCSSLALRCEWDPSVDNDQALDMSALEALWVQLGSPFLVSDPQSCWAACCNHPSCDLALVTPPQKVRSQCFLVNCWRLGQDQCVLKPSPQFKVYRSKVDSKTRTAAEGPHIVPLLGTWEPNNPESRETNLTTDIICRQPVKVGSCQAAFPKFFYNVSEQRCSSFVYGGCEGNGNNFETLVECEKTCSGITGAVLNESTPTASGKSPRRAPAFYPEPLMKTESEPAATESLQSQETELAAKQFAEYCEVEPNPGPCRAAFPRWFYNLKTGNCEKFIYGGCQGNKNNYNSKESCTTECAENCRVAPNPGPCRAAFPRWFYNLNTGNCEKFIYGGCKGNKNNYDSKENCTATCTGSFEKHSEGHHDNMMAYFLFVTLATIAALLLVALLIVSLRRRFHSQRSSSSDKQELLPDTDKHSSLESLSIPVNSRANQA